MTQLITSAPLAHPYASGTAHLDALGAALGGLRAQVGVPSAGAPSSRGCCPPGRGCSPPATAAAPPRRSTSPPRSSGGTAPSAGRCRHSRCTAEPSALTAITNDYGPDEVFARQVAAHGRPGDVCVLLSTSGGSANVVAAARRARELGLHAWALTGPAPNPLADACDEALCVPAAETAAVQELHLVALHLVCAAMDLAMGAALGAVE